MINSKRNKKSTYKKKSRHVNVDTIKLESNRVHVYFYYNGITNPSIRKLELTLINSLEKFIDIL